MKVQLIQLDKLIPYARNPRNNEEAVTAVAASIREFGFQQPIVVDEKMSVIVGHTRLKAAQKLGMEKVPVVIASELTKQQVKAYRLVDNKVAEAAEWDFDLLGEELDELNEDFDFVDLGFDRKEIADILGNLEPDTRDHVATHVRIHISIKPAVWADAQDSIKARLDALGEDYGVEIEYSEL